jgi:hypothetical protein
MSFLWDFYQQGQISDLRENTSIRHERLANRVDRDVERLQDRIDTLTLTNLAMWTLLREKLGITDEQLEARVRQLDLGDGKLDGKVSAPHVWNCEACKRPNATRHLHCLYCGIERIGGNPFPLR